MENNKMIKSAKVIDRLLKIIQGFMVAGIIVSVIFIPLTLIFKEKVIVNATSLNIGQLSLTLYDTSVLDFANAVAPIIAVLVLAIIACAIGWYCIKLLRTIFEPMKEGRPFAEGIAKKIRRLAWVSLIGGAVVEIVHVVGVILELNMYDLTSIFNPAVVGRCSINYSINGNFAILAIVLFLLSHIFRYGETLQKESDETL